MYVWAMVLVQFSAWLYTLIPNAVSNRHISHYYFAVQFILISLFYRKRIESAIWKKAILLFTVVVPVIVFSQYIFTEGLYYQFNLLETLLCSLFPVTYILRYFYESLKNEKRKWLLFSGGMFVYLISSCLIFAGGDLVLKKYGDQAFHNFWLINNFIYVIYQLLTIAEWVINFRKVPSNN